MKLSYLLLLFCLVLISVNAQRRPSSSSDSESTPKSTARRGRTRFVTNADQPHLEEASSHQEVTRRANRRRPEATLERRAPPAADAGKRNYEVEEAVDETPLETLRKPHGKSRVLTETRFEAQNAPSSSTLFQPATTENLDEVLKSIGEIADTTSSSVPASSTQPINSFEPAAQETSSENEIRRETTRSQPESTTAALPRSTESRRRANARGRSNQVRSNQVEDSTQSASRSRSRTRPTRKPEDAPISTTPTSGRTVHRGNRRRPDSNSETPSRTRGPSVLASTDTDSLPSRTRSGRKISTTSRRTEESKAPEKITIDLPAPRGRNDNRRVSLTATTTTERSSRRSSSRADDSRRSRSKSRDIPPIIDEQKLEVLPLFEGETKTVRPTVRKSVKIIGRRRNLNTADDIVETSATEHDIKIAPKAELNEINPTTPGVRQSVIVETRTESSFKRRKVVTSKPTVKETIISEVSEVTSKSTIGRKTLPRTSAFDNKAKRIKVDEPKISVSEVITRGRKKSETNSASVKGRKNSKTGLTSSEEEIDDTDNYPPQFKALLQAKKQNKESRPAHRLQAVTKTPTAPLSTSTQQPSSEAPQLEESDNELVPTPSTSTSIRPTRRRFQPVPTKSVEKPSTTRQSFSTKRTKVIRSTTIVPSTLSSREHRFHAKFNTVGSPNEEITESSVKTRSFSPKPPRGLYSSRKNKEGLSKITKSSTGQIPTSAPLKKSSRYSARYRGDSARGVIRTSTSAPAYLPTIPTVTPPSTSVKWSIGQEDKDLGIEVISFDDPVNTVPSANLVNEEFLSSSTESNHLTSPLVAAAQIKATEKPVSIIERIINSITAISTTEVPDPSRLTTPVQETLTKESAILKLATKKPTKLDKTQTDKTTQKTLVTVTTEKPTTIIERILSSLSAIQAENGTDVKTFKQVGTDFNTISSPSTTPISRVTKSTLPAQFSTSVNPLSVLDEISNEQTLQKRTIGKLLSLLNTLTSTTPGHLVVVTPKTTSFISSTTTVTPEPVVPSTTTTTLEPVTTTTTTMATTPLEVTTSQVVGTTGEISTTQESTTESTTTTSTTPANTQLFTSPTPRTNPQPTVSLSPRIQEEAPSTLRYTVTPTVTSSIPETTTILTTSTQSSAPTNTPSISTTESSTTPNDITNELGVLPLFVDPSVTSLVTQSTPMSISTTFSSTDAVDTETAFTFPSTLPSLINFEVSPGSVSIFSANDISNAITPDDSSSTVTISSRTNAPETVATTESTTSFSSPSSTMENSTPFNESTVESSTTTENNMSGSNNVTIASRIGDSTEGTTIGVTESTTDMVTESSTLLPMNDSVASNNTTQDISSNVIETGGPLLKPNQTDSTNSSVLSNRAGRLLNIVQEPVQNSLETTTGIDKDYFIFAVLNNNTILRKRPSRFPTKDTPFLVVGVYPNNTIVRKFPNGTLVPMEPIIRVSGFDTRANPPPLPEITSNQVTPDQGRRPDNTNLQTVEQNTIPSADPNPLSISSTSSPNSTETAVENSTVQANPLSVSSSSTSSTPVSSTTVGSTIMPSSTTVGASTTTPSTVTLPTLTEILNGKTVQAFNSIINISDLTKVETLKVDPKSNSVTTMLPTNPTLSNRILEDTKTTTTGTTTNQPTTTTEIPTVMTQVPTTTPELTTVPPTRAPSTVLPISQPVTSTFRTTTGFPSTTFFPTFLTTLLSTIQPRKLTTTLPPTTTPLATTTTMPPTTTTTTTEAPTTTTTTLRTTTEAKIEIKSRSGELATASTTRRSVTTVLPPTSTVATTIPASNTLGDVRTTTSSQLFTSPQPESTDTTRKAKKLSEQQLKDLQTLADLEREQAAILKQLAFLTNLNFGNSRTITTTERNNLANRIIALAVERDKQAKVQQDVATTTTTPPSLPRETLSSEGSREAKKISTTDGKSPSIEELLRQFNIAPSTLTSQSGKSNDAIIAALLKEQGIGPTTPKRLSDIYSQTTTTTRKPKPTTRAPGPLMQSLNWLLNALAPPTTRRPKPKPKPKPKVAPQEELLTHQPTHITPVVTAAPPNKNLVNSLSQEDIQKLIKQLEGIQRNPDDARSLDLSSIKSLQSLINTDKGVQVSSAGSTGTTPRSTTPSGDQISPIVNNRGRSAKSTTPVPLSVSNSIEDVEIIPTTTTAKPKASLPPLRLRPVPGIEESDTMVRGQLITAAVNVTRAISSFLGTALQGAASSFQTLLGSGSRVVGSLMHGSSNMSSRPG